MNKFTFPYAMTTRTVSQITKHSIVQHKKLSLSSLILFRQWLSCFMHSDNILKLCQYLSIKLEGVELTGNMDRWTDRQSDSYVPVPLYNFAGYN